GDSYHVFSWGFGRKSITALTYRAGEQPVLAGDGGWFWHPGEQAIRGFLFAEGMGIDVFEYTSRWDGATLVSDLVTYGTEGSEGHYEERWEFIGPDTYEWSLWARTGAGLEQAMSGTFQRKH
ncbi:MAG: hypothetical protein KJO87_07295, partial [Acidimicrobiia bacterium]|nr:hypothetical protein [Acidimicrobiia bacterium]NNL71139.1 hypothetical protein [Acidimicrobiia bacterium]